jgi:hypothetical protein
MGSYQSGIKLGHYSCVKVFEVPFDDTDYFVFLVDDAADMCSEV